MEYDYKVTVIGGGPGGYVAAIRAAKLGMKTCLIESDKLGGTCLNVGCIPAKTFVKTAELYREMKNAASFGICFPSEADCFVDMIKLRARKKSVTERLTGGVSSLLAGNKVDVIQGQAVFEDEHTVTVDGKEIRSEYFIIATGSDNYIPEAIRIEGTNHILTNVEFFDLDQVPASMIVLGAGVIGMEFAYVMNCLGCDVSVIELSSQILPAVDKEIADLVKKHMEKAGVKFYMNSAVDRICDDTAYFTQNGERKKLEAACVLLSVGRRPRIDGMGLEKLNLEIADHALACDLSLRTSIPHIYAVGDVNGKKMLAGTASHEGIVAVNNIAGANETVDYNVIPNCAYLVPEVACVGLTEAQAKEQYGDQIKVGRFPAFANGRSLTEGETDGMFKVILDSKYGEILGVHLYGNHVTEMISEFALAMSAEITADEILRLVHPHPTVNESLGEMVMAAWSGGAIHSM